MGWVTPTDGGYSLGDGTVVMPDVGFIRFERARTLLPVFPVAPDLAVEVVSPNEDVLHKAARYLTAGTQVVWAVYVDERLIRVITRSSDSSLRVEGLAGDDLLTGGTVLPGFAVPVREVFAVLDASPDLEA